MKRKFKTAVCLGLSALAMISCISGVSAVNTDKILSSRTITVDPSKVSDDFLLLSGAQSDEQDLIDASNAIKEAAIEFASSVNITEYNIDVSDAMTLFNYVRYQNPELINVSNSVSYNYYSNGVICDFYLNYLFTADEKDSYFTPFNAVVDDIVKQAKKQPTDFLKALYVHDYIIANSEYATEIYDPVETVSGFVYNAYGNLVNRRAVCQGYSMAYKVIMDKLNIPVDFASSTEMNHIWNTMTIDGSTYHVDLTFDDPVPDMQGYVGPSNFLCTDEEITATDHSSWTTSSTISAESYPNRFWKDITSKIIIRGNEAVYAAYDSTKKSHLERRILTTNEASVIDSSLNGTRWLTSSGTSYFAGCFSRIELVGDVLYYSLPGGVNAITIYGDDDQSVYSVPGTATGSMFGFARRDGKYYGELTTSPSTDGEISEITLSEFKRSVIPGDVNGDGVLTMLDALMVQKHTVQLITLDANAFKVADMNGDGKISIIDALILQRTVLTM